MKFVHVRGEELFQLVDAREATELKTAGVVADSEIRINRQGDIEVLQNGNWSIIGGLLGDYESRIRRITGQDWT
jgi:hypothetical protein